MNGHTLALALHALDQPTDAAAIHAAALLLLPHIERGQRIDAAILRTFTAQPVPTMGHGKPTVPPSINKILFPSTGS